MENRSAGDRPLLFRRNLRAEGRLGHRAAIAGWVLTVFNYVPEATQTATALTGIKLLVSVIPGVLYMSCAIFMLAYNIDSRTTDLMQVELKARRKLQESRA